MMKTTIGNGKIFTSGHTRDDDRKHRRNLFYTLLKLGIKNAHPQLLRETVNQVRYSVSGVYTPPGVYVAKI